MTLKMKYNTLRIVLPFSIALCVATQQMKVIPKAFWRESGRLKSVVCWRGSSCDTAQTRRLNISQLDAKLSIRIDYLLEISVALLTAFEITFENGLSADIVSVSHLLAERELVLELGGINCANKSLTKMQFVYSKVDFQQLVDQIQHSPAFCIFIRWPTVNSNKRMSTFITSRKMLFLTCQQHTL